MRFTKPPVHGETRPAWSSARFATPGEAPSIDALLAQATARRPGESDEQSLLPPPSQGRSDRFEIAIDIPEPLPASTEIHTATPSPSSSSSASTSHEVRIDSDPPPETQTQTPREQITAQLDKRQFAAPPGPLRDAQVALEREYIDWAATVADKREAIFGEKHYSIGADHDKNFGDAVLPAVYDFARQFISSSSRSPVRNAIATHFAPHYTQVSGQRVNVGEFSNGWDSSIVGGALGGLTAHVVDGTLLTAMDREAKKANMPQLKPVDLKALVPDPGDIQLSIDGEGKKVYWRLSDTPQADMETGQGAAEGRPTRAQLQEEVNVRRQALASVQDILEAKNWGLYAQPAVTAGFNVLRRLVMPAASLLQPLPVFVGSVIASGTAGGLTKLGLGLMKPTAQADVDDLVGGQQHVDLFATKLPDASQEPARFSDIGKLPGRSVSALKETVALGARYVAGPWQDSNSWVPSRDASLSRIGDVMRSVAANTLASVLSTATGPHVASVMRHGLTVPGADEASDSPAYLLQQAATSATNDYVWQAAREAHKNSAFDSAASLDRWRTRTDRPHSD